VFFLQDVETYRRVLPVVQNCKCVQKFILFDPAGVNDDRVITLAELEAAGSDLAHESPDLTVRLGAAVESEDIATLIYTSGTTGEPKGVMLTHANLISNAIAASADYPFSADDISLSVLPLSHVFERTGMYVYLMCGMKV